MSPLALVPATLAWLGRQGTRAVAASIFIAVLLPPLSPLFRPIVTETVFLLLCVAFLRVGPEALREHFSRPLLVIGATLWMMLATPTALGVIFLGLDLPATAPALLFALILQATAPPLMAAPAFAALLRLDAPLSLMVLVLAIVLAPFSGPVFVQIFFGTTMEPFALGLRLFLLLAGSALVAAIVRRVAGADWVDRQRERIDGLNVVLLFIFASALMGSVGERFLAEPMLVLGLVALSFVLALAIGAVTTLVFLRAGKARAFALGLTAGNRNMALALAATGGVVPDLTWLYFALAQFPIYLLPLMLEPVARWLAPNQAPASNAVGAPASTSRDEASAIDP